MAVAFALLMIIQPLFWLGFFYFGAYWYGKKERLTEEMKKGAYEAGARWIEEWAAEGKPVREWPGNNPPPYYEERYWGRYQ